MEGQRVERYRVLVLGDFHFGESYARGGAKILAEQGYEHSTVNLRPFVDACDSVVVNLETPLVRPEDSPSPFTGQKTYVHWGDPVATGRELRNMGVDAVSLANNHTVDHGPEGLEATFRALSDCGISWFGAGRTLEEARRPYRVALPDRVGGGEFHFHGSFQYSTRSDEDFGFYASEESSGCAPLSVANVPWARSDGVTQEDSFQVAFPHWGANYAWRGRGQYRLAHRFLRKDYDLVLGHGGHNMQEVHRKQQRWVVYGIGNGNFQSGGRWQRYEEENGILPFSFWTVLEVQRQDGRRWVELKLYPVYSDNSVTNYQPGPVTEPDFNRVLETLRSRPARPWRFDNPAQSAGQDDLGFFVSLDLGTWPEGDRPSRLEPALESGDPGDWPLRSPNAGLEAEILGSERSMSPSMLTIPAEAEGGTVRWFGKLALIEAHGKRLLAWDYRVHESSLGAAIVEDKVLTAELLEKAGVPTPKTVVVNSADEAVSAASAISGPVVVKPRDGRKSRGVSTGLVDDHEVRQAFVFARSYGAETIVQEHVDVEEELRVMASPEQAVAVIRRIAPHVTGDGTSTVGQLIEDKNLQRRLNPHLNSRLIPVDELTHRQLGRNGLSLDSVLAMGQTITVRDVAGLSVGADAFQAVEETDPQIKTAASVAMAAIPGMGWGGVDILIEKHSGKPYVIEINSQAGYGGAVFPTYGQPRDVGAEVWPLRHAATAPEPEAAPEVAETNTRPTSIIHDISLLPERGSVEFTRLFKESLARQNYTIEQKNRRVLHVSTSQGQETWVTHAGRTAADRYVVQKVMQSHEWVCNLLDVAEISRPRSRVITSASRLRQFVEGRVSSVNLTPISARWDGLGSHILTDQQALEMTSLPGKMWVQTRPRGRRLRVLATRGKSWVVTTKAGLRPLEEEYLAAAGQLAVHAVRAIPELSWAAVDLVVRQSRFKEGRRGGVLIEGLTLEPEYTTEDQIIVGDFDAFVRWVVEFPAFKRYDGLTPGSHVSPSPA